QAIQEAQARQAQINQNQLSILSQLGVQLQSGAGQFANSYNQSLAGMPGQGGGQGGPDPQKAFQGFQAGYQTAQGLIQQQQGQPGGPSQAYGGADQINRDAADYQATAIKDNPFAVLPAAYGRQAQMDAELMAATQAAQMNE